jgi:hypothetical protein
MDARHLVRRTEPNTGGGCFTVKGMPGTMARESTRRETVWRLSRWRRAEAIQVEEKDERRRGRDEMRLQDARKTWLKKRK